jgi:hypothetical protein
MQTNALKQSTHIMHMDVVDEIGQVFRHPQPPLLVSSLRGCDLALSHSIVPPLPIPRHRSHVLLDSPGEEGKGWNGKGIQSSS